MRKDAKMISGRKLHIIFIYFVRQNNLSGSNIKINVRAIFDFITLTGKSKFESFLLT